MLNRPRQLFRRRDTLAFKSQIDPTHRTSPHSPQGEKQKTLTKVDFCELPNGTVVEQIEDPHNPTKHILAIFENGHVRYAESLKTDNRILVPVPAQDEIFRHLIFAKGTEPHEDIPSLVGLIVQVLESTLDLEETNLILLAIFIVSTWFVEKLPAGPYLALVGPPGSGKTTALRILSLLCRRSLATADISSAAFYEVCDRMTPTLLIDEAATTNNRRELFHLLRAGSTPGFVALRRHNSFKAYGARVVAWLELPDDAALNSRFLVIPMRSGTRTDLLSPTDPKIEYWTDRLRKQLLLFRLTNFKTLALAKLSGEEQLQPRSRDIYRTLALPVSGEEKFPQALVMLLKLQESLRETLPANHLAVLDALHTVIHTVTAGNGYNVSGLTEIVNENLKRSGEYGNLSEKKVGNILTSLNLTSRTRTNSGYVLWFDRKTREHISSLFRLHRAHMLPKEYVDPECELCLITNERSSIESAANPAQADKGDKSNDSNQERELGELGERRGGKPKAT